MSKFLKYCKKMFKTKKSQEQQKVFAKFGKKINAINIKIKTKTFIVKDIQEAKKNLKYERDINDNVFQYGQYFIEQKKRKKTKKLPPGEKKEREFVKYLQNKFQGYVINDNDSYLLSKKGIKINSGDKIIRIEQFGTKVDKETGSKKPDVIIFFLSNKCIGISYKMTKSRTVQSWTSNKKWETLLDKENLKIIVDQLPKILRNEINNRDTRTFLGITFHLTNNPKKIPLTRFFRNNIGEFYFDSKTDLVFTGSKFDFRRFSNFLESNKLQNKKEILNDPKKQLYFDIRYIYSDTTSSNNSAQALLYYKPDDIIKDKKFNNVKEMLKFGSFVPYYNHKVLTGTISRGKKGNVLNTNNLCKLYQKKNITFNTKKEKF
jgi:hypothetical protein